MTTLARIVAGYLGCAAWADAPEGSRARFTAAATRDAGAVCAAFVAYIGPDLAAQALQCVSPERFGHDLWLTRCGHGAGFWGPRRARRAARHPARLGRPRRPPDAGHGTRRNAG